MIDDRTLLRHLQDGGPELFDLPEAPELDLAAITGAPVQGAAAPRPSRRRWQLSPMSVVAGAAACVAIGLFGGAALSGDTPDAPRQVAASTPPATTPEAPPARSRQIALARFGAAAPRDAIAEAKVFTATDGRTVDLRVSGLAQPRKGEFYELWVLGEGTRMISLGIVRVDATGSASVRLPLPVSLRRFPVFDLSLEPGDGNPKHSGDSLLRSAAIA